MEDPIISNFLEWAAQSQAGFMLVWFLVSMFSLALIGLTMERLFRRHDES